MGPYLDLPPHIKIMETFPLVKPEYRMVAAQAGNLESISGTHAEVKGENLSHTANPGLCVPNPPQEQYIKIYKTKIKLPNCSS